jgi:23S rRNA (cytosine1962-C5)-methyltransferase
MELLTPDGELFFSTNLRSFKLDASALAPFFVQDVSVQTVPEDFRNKKIHYCWLIKNPLR